MAFFPFLSRDTVLHLILPRICQTRRDATCVLQVIYVEEQSETQKPKGMSER